MPDADPHPGLIFDLDPGQSLQDFRDGDFLKQQAAKKIYHLIRSSRLRV
jgi:hypothetical protein